MEKVGIVGVGAMGSALLERLQLAGVKTTAFDIAPAAMNVAKLIKNLVTGSETLIVYEAIRIGQAGGIPCGEALEMMRKTRSESVLNRWQRNSTSRGPARHYEPVKTSIRKIFLWRLKSGENSGLNFL